MGSRTILDDLVNAMDDSKSPAGTPSAAPQAGPPQDPNAQWMDSRLAVRSELRFDVRSNADSSQVVIEDPVRGKFFQVGIDEYRLIALLDGKRSLAELLQAGQSRSGQTISEESAMKVCQWLVQNNLVFGHAVNNIKQLESQAKIVNRQKMMGLLNPISCKFKLFSPNKLLAAVQPYTQWLFSIWMFVVWLALAVYAMSILWVDWDKLSGASTGIFAGSSWIWLLIIWAVLKVVHEAAHGVACRRFGGEVPEAGVLLLLFTPMAYVNVTSMWRFGNRWHRIIVAAAGMYVELFISFVSLVVWQRFPGVVGDIAFDVFIMSSVTTIMFNANPLMRFDGYFILSDLVQVPNLYTKGTKWFGDQLKRLFFGIPKPVLNCSKSELRSVAIYGTLAYFWKFTISFGLIIAASVLFYGAGIVLAALGVVLWFGLPILNQVKSLFGPNAAHPVNKARMVVSFSILAFMLFGMFSFFKAPATKSAPAIVQFAQEQVLRANASGFVERVLVASGDRVVKGQELIVLRNDQLAVEVFELERKAEESKIESRIQSQAGELAMAQAATELYESLIDQLAEKREELSGLTLTAPFDGFVYQRNLAMKLESFANRGDALLSIAQAETKEVVVSIDQRDAESIRGSEGTFLRVAFPGMRVFESKLIHVDPRASAKPTHPAMCANVGGPLPVKPASSSGENDGSQFELLDPRFSVELELHADVGEQLQSGQRGTAFFATHRQSLGSYFFIATRDWLQDKIEMATQTAVF